MNQDHGSAIITLSNGKQVHASITIEETKDGYSMVVTGTPTAGAVVCETLWERHGNKGEPDGGGGMSAFLHFDGMTWPDPADPTDVAWRLVYGTPSRGDLLIAASVFGAYAQLVEDPQRIRNSKIARLRELTRGGGAK